MFFKMYVTPSSQHFSWCGIIVWIIIDFSQGESFPPKMLLNRRIQGGTTINLKLFMRFPLLLRLVASTWNFRTRGSPFKKHTRILLQHLPTSHYTSIVKIGTFLQVMVMHPILSKPGLVIRPSQSISHNAKNYWRFVIAWKHLTHLTPKYWQPRIVLQYPLGCDEKLDYETCIRGRSGDNIFYTILVIIMLFSVIS